MRTIFLIYFPENLNNEKIKKGLESVPSSLLVALVIPYTFFIGTEFLLFRGEVSIILIVAFIVKYTKKPGLSLTFALIMLFAYEALIGI